MKKLAAVLFVVALAASAQASLIVDEQFTYSDGPVTTVSAGVWNRYSGTADPSDAMISGNQLIIDRGETDDVQRDLGSDYSSGSLYVGFTLNMTAAPSSEQSVFGLKADTTTLRDRLYVNAPTAGGGYTVGVSPISSGVIYWAGDLALDTTYQIVMRADIDTDTTYLWVNPLSEVSTSVNTNGATTAIAANVFARQNTGEGIMAVDNLLIATTFAEVVIPEPGTMTMMGLGLLALVTRRFRR